MQLEILQIFAHKTPIRYQKGETIIRAGEDPRGVYFLKSGFVRMYVIFRNGRELTLNIFKPRSYFSMIWALTNKPNLYFFQAFESCELLKVSKKEILAFMQTNPKIFYELVSRILTGMDGLLTNISHLLSGSSNHRVMTALHMLAKRFGTKDSQGKILINLAITHQDIANFSGITRETASIAIKKLERKNIISQKKHLIIINPMKLEAELALKD